MNNAQLSALELTTEGDVYDADYDGWQYNAVRTAETIEQFVESSAQWVEQTHLKRGQLAGMSFVAWESMQAKRGDIRTSLSVLDFGDYRMVIKCDLTSYV